MLSTHHHQLAPRLARAHAQGWIVTHRPHVDWTARLPGQNAGGVSVSVSGVVNGLPVAVAEYSFSSSGAVMIDSVMVPTTQTYEFVVYVVWVRPELRRLSIAVENRSAGSMLGRLLFGDSPTATGNKAFDSRFKIWARPPELARRIVGPALVAEHLAGRLPTWNLDNGTLVSYHPGRLQDPTALPALTAPLARVAGLLGR